MTQNNLLLTKSQAAFIMTAQTMFETWDKIYFWTFTFKDVWPDWWYPPAWNRFITELRNCHAGQLMGLRVVESFDHGLHYHALLNIRVSVHLVRRIGKKYGIGWVDVRRCDEGAAFYLAKYLGKHTGTLTKGMRRWGTIGGMPKVRKNDIEVDSSFHRNMKKIGQGTKLSWTMTTQVYRTSRLHGDLRQWPQKDVMKLGPVIMERERRKKMFDKEYAIKTGADELKWKPKTKLDVSCDFCGNESCDGQCRVDESEWAHLMEIADEQSYAA